MEKGNIYKIFLIIIFAVVWIWAAINPLYRDGWLLENYLVFVFVPVILIAAYFFRLSNLSYTLITLFMCLHVIGSHYTYAEVPFGYVLQEMFNSSRNMYDRLVHFSFGLLLYYPMREVLIRLGKLKGTWALYFPIDIVLACSAFYELIEFWAAGAVNPEAGLAFLGAQGDIWDAQKDMMMAFIGSVISMILTIGINFSLNKKFWEEVKQSMKIEENDSPWGEFKIIQWLREKESKIVSRK